jgi:hypothetical protein
MEQIRCPKCKGRHWVCREALECLEGPDLRSRVVELERELAGLRAGPKVKTDRKTYMREYMRKRRSK